MINMSNLTNISSLQGMAFFTNNMTDGVLFVAGIIGLFFVILFVLSRNGEPFVNVLAVSSWSMFLLSAFLWYSQLIGTLYVLAFLFLGALSVLYMYTSKA